jgi:hypothetical protein
MCQPKTLQSTLDESAWENLNLLTDNHTDDDFEQDVGADLEVSIQLSKVGHYDRAMSSFDENLNDHSMLFPVAAEYGDALLEQDVFGRADEFLRGILNSEFVHTMASDQVDILKLLSAIARTHASLN